MANRWSVVKGAEKLLCGHPNTEENVIRFGNYATCLTCRTVHEYIPAHWIKKTRSKKPTDTSNTTEAVSSEPETVNVTA